MQERKVISIETKKCCNCGKTLYAKLDQFALNEKQVLCYACWDAQKATQPVVNLVQFPDKF